MVHTSADATDHPFDCLSRPLRVVAMFDPKDARWIIPVVSVVAGIAAVAVAGGLVIKLVFKKSDKIFLQGQNIKLPMRLVDKEVITHDTTLYTFGLPSTEYVLGVPAGNCVILHARIGGEDVKRPYTPVTLDDYKGYVKFLIKAYRKNVNPNFPAGGKMTQYLESLDVGDAMEVSGPSGLIHYCGDGLFEVKGGSTRKVLATNVNMICGGTGLTPMYQLLKYILNSSSDKTKIAMIFANQTEKDILLRDELEQLRDQNSTQFRIWYTVESPPQHWTYDVGYLDQKMLEEHCYPASDTTVNLLCGPASMIKNACLPNLAALGHSKENILTF
ncbi:NADH-cytochrome b5 reductase 3 [Taenia solium]|eukprot:TsM_000852300 transcript=TsM_000852300 gene=TsM_000852300